MSWPGNIRQLKNTIERALILGSSKNEITPEDIYEFTETPKDHNEENNIDFNNEFFEINPFELQGRPERAYLTYQISKFGGNVSKTASYVGMERSAFIEK